MIVARFLFTIITFELVSTKPFDKGYGIRIAKIDLNPSDLNTRVAGGQEGSSSSGIGGLVVSQREHGTKRLRPKLCLDFIRMPNGAMKCRKLNHEVIKKKIQESNEAVTSTVTQCFTTNDSPCKNALCVFPFKFNGVIKNTCINDTDPDGKYWCSTKVDDNLEHIGGQGNWGFCRKSCPLLNPKIITTRKASTSSERPKINNLEKYISGYIDEVDYYEDYDESYDIL
jgi:hypothetical protein